MQKAHKGLGTKKAYVYDYPDNRFDAVALLEIIKTIGKIKREVKPDIVFIHHGGDLNIDHQVVLNAVLAALRPLPNEKTTQNIAFEVASSTEWNSPETRNYFMPVYFIDISTTLKAKLKAMEAYRSEIRKFRTPGQKWPWKQLVNSVAFR